MANLLDQASIVLTPTAYDNGKVLCAKPIDGSGDFDFSRNSAATRVNAQGLVEDVQILSSDLVQNGSFSEQGSQEITNGSFSQQGTEQIVDGSFANGDADWNRENSVFTISDGVANGNGANGGSEELSQNFSQDLTAGKTYKVVFELLNYVSGSVQFVLTGGGSLFGTSQSADGTFTQYVVILGNNNKIKFRGANFNGSITSISLVEVGQDWVLGGEVTIGNNLAHFESNTNTYSYIRQDISSLTTKQYKIQVEVKNYVSGAVQVGFSGSIINLNVTTDGVYTAYTSPNTSGLLFEVSREFNGGNFNFDVTNISVKEVGQNWTFPNDWEVGNNKIIGLGSGFGGLTQTISLQNKKIKVTFDILDYVSGTFRVPPTYRQDGLDERFSGNGSYEIIYTSLVDIFTFQPQLFDGSITNIKIIEITDDTNLPRINYEGFSYQDALGSELVTNGDFATDSDWSLGANTTISSGALNFSSAASNTDQSLTTTNTKIYKVVFTISNYVSGSVRFRFTGAANVNGTTRNTNGTFTQYITATANNSIFRFAANSFTGSIDNVSVKEYLGQEVVPDSGCGSWLWEPQSTNLIPYSELFSNNAWTRFNSSLVSGFKSPSGDQGAFKIAGNGAFAFHNIFGNFSTNNSIISCFAKQGTIKYFQFVDTIQSPFPAVEYNLEDGTAYVIEAGTLSNPKIENYGNGWYRCSAQATATNRLHLNISTISGNGESTVNASDYLYIWGAQLENQSYATSYIPTDGTSVTRNQDLCINGGSASTINSTEGSLYAEIAANSNDLSFRLVSLSDGTTSNRVYIGFGSISNQITASLTSSGSQQAFLSHIVSDETQYNKVALKYKLNELSLFVNGSKVATDTTVTMPTLTSLQFTSASTSSKFFGKTKCLAVWKETLTDTELQELTTI